MKLREWARCTCRVDCTAVSYIISGTPKGDSHHAVYVEPTTEGFLAFVWLKGKPQKVVNLQAATLEEAKAKALLFL